MCAIFHSLGRVFQHGTLCWAAEFTFKNNLTVSVVQALVGLTEDLASIGRMSTL